MRMAILLMAVMMGASKPSPIEEISRLAGHGRYGEAERLARKSTHPFAKAYLAQLIHKDTIGMRNRGIITFDPALATKLIKESLPYLKANAPNDPEAAGRLGSVYFWGVGMEPNEKLGFQWWLFAAKKGRASAMGNVGVCYTEGRGVTQDDRAGFSWLEKGEAAGDIHSAFVIGQYFYDGIGRNKNLAVSSKQYENAANAGSIDGMLGCAKVAIDRMGKANDSHDFESAGKYIKSAKKWLQKASDAGDASATFQLGLFWRLTTFGSLSDPDQSFRCYKDAANSGTSLHLSYLACCYLKGWGCTADRSRAAKLLEQAEAAAVREKNEESQEKIKELLAMKTPEEQTVAMGEWLDWKEEPVQPLVAAPLSEPVAPLMLGKSAPNEKLVLTDIAITPAGIENTFYIDGRIQNISGEAIKRLKIEVSIEDRQGGLLGTTSAYVTPDPLEPRSRGTFKAIDMGHPAIGRIKIEITSGDKAVPWIDRSGKNVHD